MDEYTLSDRCLNVLQMLADGYSVKEIATKLSYSENTIKNDVFKIITRMGARNRVHAVAQAIRTDMI